MNAVEDVFLDVRIACAQGAALISMVCDLTTAKKKYADDHELCRQIKEEAVRLYGDLKAAIDKDTDAYNLVAAAFLIKEYWNPSSTLFELNAFLSG